MWQWASVMSHIPYGVECIGRCVSEWSRDIHINMYLSVFSCWACWLLLFPSLQWQSDGCRKGRSRLTEKTYTTSHGHSRNFDPSKFISNFNFNPYRYFKHAPREQGKTPASMGGDQSTIPACRTRGYVGWAAQYNKQVSLPFFPSFLFLSN